MLPIRCGSTPNSPARVRMIFIARSASDADPNGARADDPPWHRLGAVQIASPPLSQRREDVPEIFRLFVARHARALDLAAPAISEVQWHHVQTHDWPGNLHELSAYARAFVLGRSDIGAPTAPLAGQRPLQQIVADSERTVLEDALRQCRGDIGALQAMLQTPRKTIYDKLAKYDLKPSRFR